MSSYVLAVNGGGTKTNVLCTDLQGGVVGQGESGPTNLTATSVGAASFNLREAVRQATEKLPQDTEYAVFVMGLSGMDTPPEQQQAQQIFAEVLSHHNLRRFHLVHSSVITLEGGTNNPNAVVIMSGTGSICYGRNVRGQETKTGGMDLLLTDQGSGYIIGRQVLREAVKSFDGRREKSLLEQLVSDHFHIASIAELKDRVSNPQLSKAEIADLTKVGLQALEQGDKLAKWIFDHANESLVSLAATVIKKLQMEQEQVDCVVAGKVLQIPYIKEHFIENMHFVCNGIQIIEPDKDPVYGGVKLALRLIGQSSYVPLNSL